MREVALSVTETEVRLSLPQQESPQERVFGIEGIVDIVREEDQTRMYDIKTHDAEYVRSHRDLYEDQLNVYAYIWQELQNQSLDGTAVICTDFPREVKEALSSGNEERLDQAIQNWEPLIEIDFDRRKVDETIRDFGRVVDQIENREFSPPSLEKLQEVYVEGRRGRFGTQVCRNCDARFSCDSYRKFARQGRGIAEQRFNQYYQTLETSEPLEEWRTAGLDDLMDLEGFE